MTDLGQLKFFLGIEIEQDSTIATLTMQQIQFASDILTKFIMENSKPVRTPQDPGLKLTKSMCEG